MNVTGPADKLDRDNWAWYRRNAWPAANLRLVVVRRRPRDMFRRAGGTLEVRMTRRQLAARAEARQRHLAEGRAGAPPDSPPPA